MKLRVVMLGWEFPPVVNGGLGVACFGLARALSELVDLRVIVPLAEPESAAGFRAGGIADPAFRASLARLRDRHRYEEFARLGRIAVRLDPYALGGETRPAEGPVCLEGGGLYGGDLGAKVAVFSGLAVHEAMKWRAKTSGVPAFDLIHAHDWMTFPAALALKESSGRPLVVHIHSLEFDRAGGRRGGWIYDIERRAMEAADRVIPVSRYTGDVIERHYWIDPKKIHPVHNGVEPVEAFKTPKKFPEPLVLFLGRLTDQKGPETFVEIAARILKKTRNVRFAMAGDGEKLRRLLETRSLLGLGKNFHFTGFLDRAGVRKLLSMADVYCMPSRSEPFGLSALEAAQFGVPAVVSKQSGVAEVLDAALRADHRDIDAMARHILRLLEDENLRARVVARQFENLKNATWERAAREVASVFLDLARNPDRSENP